MELLQFVSYHVTCSIQGIIFIQDNYKNPKSLWAPKELLLQYKINKRKKSKNKYFNKRKCT